MTLKLLERIGRGGHGEVWRARWGGRTVAAKLLGGRETLDERMVLDEAEALRNLNDPTFIGLHDVTQHEGRWVLLLEWVEGTNLRTALDLHGPIPVQGVMSIISTCASALGAAWTQPTPDGPLRLLHRDLKPANLLLQPNGHLRIADLGLATRWTRPLPGAAGTPGYAAPERYLNEDSPSGDVYSLGCIAYEMLAGRGFGLAGPHELAHARKIRSARADLEDRRIPRTLVSLVEAMLSFHPSERPEHGSLSACSGDPRALRDWMAPTWFARLASVLFLPPMKEAACALS